MLPKYQHWEKVKNGGRKAGAWKKNCFLRCVCQFPPVAFEPIRAALIIQTISALQAVALIIASAESVVPAIPPDLCNPLDCQS